MKKNDLQEEFSYKNRDIDWMSFNGRVLQEAVDKTNPLFERLKFLAIFSSNLDEFFKVRISKLRQIRKVKKSIRKPLGLKPNKTLNLLLEQVQKQQEQLGLIYRNQIKPEFVQNGIHLLELSEYNEEQKSVLENFFENEIRPVLQIISNSSTETLEALKDGGLYIAVVFDGTDDMSFISVNSANHNRFVKVSSPKGTFSYVFLEDIIKMNAASLFPNAKIKSQFNIKVSRDAELYLEDEYEGEWIEQIYEALAKRQDGQPTRLLFEGIMPKNIQKQIRRLLGLGKIDMVLGGNRHNFSDFFGFPFPKNKEKLFYKPFPQLVHREFETSNNFFDLILEKDRILHYPYQNFGYLEQWLMQAADDKLVVSIQISLYRIAKDSLLTTSLLKALENGKKVTIFVEAKARFDERNNLSWGRVFEEKGAKVFYSFPNVKVHSKILLIERKENDALRQYAYIGTGNFNAKTSKIYCDHGLFTANKKTTNDLAQVFKVLKREVLAPKIKSLLVSPFNSRLRFEKLIQNEIDIANKGETARITLKMNALEDKKMIDWLYKASSAGVEIILLVRGFCCLIPEMERFSENITVISIVDRFLEHARISLFHNGGEEQMFMGSADWMTRSLDKRVEVITPILDKDVFNELKHILKIQLSDNTKARRVDKDGNNDYINNNDSMASIRAQYAIYEYLKND